MKISSGHAQLGVRQITLLNTVYFPVQGTSRSVPELNVCCLIRDMQA